jgi:hypothetical protein
MKAITQLRKKTDKICKSYPKIERSHVYQTLVLLRKTPIERLNLALTRGQKKTLHI